MDTQDRQLSGDSKIFQRWIEFATGIYAKIISIRGDISDADPLPVKVSGFTFSGDVEVDTDELEARIGATTGAAVVTDANGTVQQYLRGLVKMTFATPSRFISATAIIGNVVHSVGAGLSDLTKAGVYTALVDHVYRFKISTAAATDKFTWSKDGGAESGEISMTGAPQAIENGLTVTFAATTGHTLNDEWTITITAGTVVKASAAVLRNIVINGAGTAAKLRVYNGVSTSGVLLYSSDALAVGLLRFDMACSTGICVVAYDSGAYPDFILGWN